MPRHYGLDWLRIGAFGLLILYHVGMAFVPWPYHVKLATLDWVTIPMLLPNAWRLSLLFLVSGYASRALLARTAGPGRFALGRTARLVVPVVFGMAVVIPPQPWVELVTQHGYLRPFGWFWLHDYWRAKPIDGIDLPTWNHLWFVVYLWIYTLLAALAVAVVPPSWRAGAGRLVQGLFDRLFGGWGVLLLPPVWLVIVNTLLFPGARESHALVDDWVAHATYPPMFLFGIGLGGSERALATLRRRWPVSAVAALLSYAVVAGLMWRFVGEVHWPRPWGEMFSAVRGVQAWASIAALVGLADRYWNRDHPWRRTLTEAVFPFYIVHQTAIVLVAYWLLRAGLPLLADFGILVVATAAICWAFYLVGRRFGWLRPLIGLRR